MKNIISIIVPTYNGERTIGRCIHSIFEQECDWPLELIIVDDGSIDSSKEIIESWVSRFEQKGDKLKYVYQQNQGPGGAINKGLKYVTGKYLTLLDADDCFLQGSIKKRMDFLEQNGDFVGVRTNGWQDKHGKRKLFDLDPERTTNENLFDGLIGGKATNWAGSYMIRTQALFAFYPTREIYASRFGQHMQLLLPVAYKKRFGYIDEPLMIYFLQDNSHSQASTQEEQMRKDDRNFYGYYDIYTHMVSEIILDEDERNIYLNIIESWKYKHELNKSMQCGDKVAARKYFRLYEDTGRITLNEKIDYYSKTSPIRAIWLKIYRRIGMVLKGTR